MGLATLGDHTFRIDPTSVSWKYAVKSRDFNTVGGKVVQIFGARIEDMTVTGSFGVGGWQEQAAFLEKMKTVGTAQVTSGLNGNTPSPPLHFRYPPKGWDFLVYLTKFTDPRGPSSVHLEDTNFAPKWSLTLFVVEDNTGLQQVAMDSFISRLADGLGWKQTSYNGPLTQADVVSLVGGGQ